jgi:hypothetical protein
MVHIVFNTADIEVLQKAIEQDESLAGEVVQIKDDFAVGPLGQIYEPDGIESRKQWWREVLAGGDYDGLVDKGEVDDPLLVSRLKQKLMEDSEEVLWIWAAQNKHDVCGYYWLISQLKEFQGRVYILYLNNLPFINEKGQIFYPEWLHVIPPREFLKAKKLARPITLSEFEVDPDEWNKLCAENPGIRILEGGKKLLQAGYDYYDSELRRFVTQDWQKASRIISGFLNKAKQTTGDAFLLWRLKGMIAEGLFDIQGTLGKMKDFELKNKMAVTENSAAD